MFNLILLNKNDIQKVISMKESIQAVKTAYSSYSNSQSINPLRTIIENEKGNGQVLFMPSHVKDMNVSGVKIVSIYPDNQSRGLDNINASMILFDGETGIANAMIDGTYLTQLRTGAATGAAIEILARSGCKNGLLIGTGGQAVCQLEAMIASGRLSKIWVYSRNEKNIDEFLKKAESEIDFEKVSVKKCENLDESVSNSDVIVTATTSKKPVFDGKLVKKGTLISAIGAYTLDMHEMDSHIVKRADKIFVDSCESIVAEAGDLMTPVKEGIISEDKLKRELGQVINGNCPGRENEDEIIIFKSVGIGTQDIAASKLIYERALEKKIGTRFEF